MTRRLRPPAHALLLVTLIMLSACSSADELVKMTAIGRSHELRKERDDGGGSSRRPGLLIIGIDGMKRAVLYELLKEGALPGLASLLLVRQVTDLALHLRRH